MKVAAVVVVVDNKNKKWVVVAVLDGGESERVIVVTINGGTCGGSGVGCRRRVGRGSVGKHEMMSK